MAESTPAPQVERGTYEILRDRLVEQARELGGKVEALNARRVELFGGTQLAQLGSERIRTENNCVPRDIVGVGRPPAVRLQRLPRAEEHHRGRGRLQPLPLRPRPGGGRHRRRGSSYVHLRPGPPRRARSLPRRPRVQPRLPRALPVLQGHAPAPAAPPRGQAAGGLPDRPSYQQPVRHQGAALDGRPAGRAVLRRQPRRARPRLPRRPTTSSGRRPAATTTAAAASRTSRSSTRCSSRRSAATSPSRSRTTPTTAAASTASRSTTPTSRSTTPRSPTPSSAA